MVKTAEVKSFIDCSGCDECSLVKVCADSHLGGCPAYILLEKIRDDGLEEDDGEAVGYPAYELLEKAREDHLRSHAGGMRLRIRKIETARGEEIKKLALEYRREVTLKRKDFAPLKEKILRIIYHANWEKDGIQFGLVNGESIVLQVLEVIADESSLILSMINPWKLAGMLERKMKIFERFTLELEAEEKEREGWR